MSYKISLDLEPTEIANEKLYKASQESNGTKKDKYISSQEMKRIVEVLIENEDDINYIRKATKLFRAERITIEK